jgi:ABC-type uncharacterized transport system permease subunit
VVLVANVPVKALSNRLESLREMAALGGMGLFCFLVSETVWRFSVGCYTCASP